MELIDASELHPERDRGATVKYSGGGLISEQPVSEPVFEPWDGSEAPPQYRHRLYRFAGLYLQWVQQQYILNQQGSTDETQQARTVESTQAGPAPG